MPAKSPKDFSLRFVQVPLPPLERFDQYLRSRGKRVTQQRRLVVEQVFSHHDHFDADELLAHLQESIAGRKLSRPTVYRTLTELVDAGLLRKMTLGGRSVFEHEYGYPRHDHLYCQVCNALIEFHSGALERLRDEVARQHDFEVLGHRMFVSGICAACRRRQRGK
jgi:Fur family ferric uptake transcriptional regulator